MIMDLQTRKINLISYLIELKDEKSIGEIEKLILKKREKEPDFKTFTDEELVQRIERSEKDFKGGKFKTQDEIEQLSANW